MSDMNDKLDQIGQAFEEFKSANDARLAEIESKAAELRLMAEKSEDDVNVDAEASALDKKAQSMLQELYKNLNPWRKCQGGA